MQSKKSTINPATKFLQSPTIVIGLTLFLALVIGTFYRINTAFETHPGLVNINAYKVGSDYAQIQKNAEILIKQGYKISLKKHNFIEIDKDFNYVVSLKKHNEVVKDAKIKFYFYRTLEKQYDFEDFALFDGDNWQLTAKLPRKGKWRIVVEANFGNNKLHIFDKIFVNNKL
jgi:nitrogen fixation protein FixH